MDNLLQDIRYAIRMMIKRPGFTIVAVITLALGIGANTAIFSVTSAVLLRPLPYKDPDRLVMVWETNSIRKVDDESVAPPNFLDWSDQNQVFEHIAAFTSESFNLTGVAEPERLEGYRVSASLFPLLGVAPAMGRTFLPEEDRFGTGRVVLLSYGLWQRQFAADPQIVGKALTLNDESHTVVGVMPQGFYFQNKEIDVWVPIAFTDQDRNSRGGHYLEAVARLKPGVALDQAQAEMNVIATRLEQQYPASNKGAGVRLVSLHEEIVGDTRPVLLLLLGAVGLVLLIACANVANMQLARAVMREKEMAIRASLGAARRRIIRQLITENILLALAGGALGLLLAFWGLETLLSLTPGDIARLEETSIDWRVLGFTLGLSIGTGLVFGLAPALHASSSEPNQSLKEGGRTTGGSSSRRLRNLLVIAEVSLALVLLTGAGLMINSFLRLSSIDPGFNPYNLLTMRMDLPKAKYGELRERANFYREVLDRVKAIPGVESAGMISFLPMAFPGGSVSFAIEGQTAPLPDQAQGAGYRVVSPDYFRAMGIPLIKGQMFSEQEAQESAGVVIINESMARRYWPGQDPLGKRLKIGRATSNSPWLSVTGVVRDIRQIELSVDPRPEMYFPYWQQHMFWAAPRALVVRTTSGPASAVAAVRGEIWKIDKDQPISEIRTMKEVVSGTVAEPRFYSALLGLLGGVALLLSALGIYGVISYSVSQRTHEIGVRMALGAGRGRILKLIISQGMTLAGIGILAGLAAAFALTRVIAGFLYDVSATDPLTFAAVSVLLALIAMLACYIPARRATKVDPMIALRYE
ncbi:MAG: ABC transporter permease [Blastocatellia bacterium]|nr:ABC transporter permease [Blastocatellia bacterium]